MNFVEVRRERLEDFACGQSSSAYDEATARAVGHLEELLPLAWRCLKSGGEIFLWLSHHQAREVSHIQGGIKEVGRISLPSCGQGEIWRGKKTF